MLRNLTGEHVTNVTNASRTLLMNLKTLDWDDEILKVMGIPRKTLPRIKSFSEIYGHVGNAQGGVPAAEDGGLSMLIFFARCKRKK